MSKISPFAPDKLPDLTPIKGVRLAACEAGIRYEGRKDLMLAIFPPDTRVAGVFTRSATASAPVDWCKEHVAQGKARALVVNSGNANAFTGMAGKRAVQITATAGANAVDCRPEEIYLASTGVIGEALDPDIFTHRLEGLAKSASEDGYEDAARAIMTTDTYPKMAVRKARLDGQSITINGFAKGSGMIAPDLGTMLAFIFTDAALPAAVLQTCLKASVKDSFNAITVDSDTSTSDTVLLFATGQKGKGGVTAGSSRLKEFRAALDDLMLDLAHQIVRDGEGLSKFVTIRVEGAANKASARKIGFSIANSPLVKTAIAGEDPNWGRIVMAVGKAGEPADRDKLDIWIGDERVTKGGQAAPEYRESRAAEHMKGQDVNIRVSVGAGKAADTVWTCDLTHGYIDINADYRS